MDEDAEKLPGQVPSGSDVVHVVVEEVDDDNPIWVPLVETHLTMY